jgi:hypothetical protein
MFTRDSEESANDTQHVGFRSISQHPIEMPNLGVFLRGPAVHAAL